MLFTILVFFTGLYLGILRIVIPVIERQLGIAIAISTLLPLITFGFVKEVLTIWRESYQMI
jgi:hypothetical protein